MKYPGMRCVVAAFLAAVAVRGQEEPCPRECTCQQLDSSRFLVDCSDRKMTEVPVAGPWPDSFELVVNFDNNQIRRIVGFPQLRVAELSMRHNGLTDIFDGAFQNLTALNVLDLAYNNLTSLALQKETFRGIQNTHDYAQLTVQKLDLSGNKLHSLDKDLFDHLEGLQELILNDNDLQEIDAQTTAAISSITALESLSLAETGLTDLPQGVFNSLIQLTWMNLANNEFETVPTKAIGSARNLRDLNLNGNPIRELNQQSFVGMSELTALNISAMPELTVIRRETFAPLRKLHSLRCSNNNKLTSIDPFAFEGIADSRNEYPIREILLNENSLKKLPSGLLPWEKLDLLDIQGNPWVCDCEMKWVAISLMDDLERMNPSLTQYITCDKPDHLHGHELVVVALDPEQFVCKGRKPGASGASAASGAEKETNASGATIAVILTGILIIVLSVAALMWMMHGKKSSGTTQVQYTRAPEDDVIVGP